MSSNGGCHLGLFPPYSDEEEICNLCCRLLNKIVKRQRDLYVSFLVRFFDLCRFWLQSNETSIHDSYYVILSCLPVNILTSKLSTHGTLLSSKNDYSGFAGIVKRNHMNTLYLGTFKAHCFSLILGYVLVNHEMPYEQLPNVGNDTLFWAIWECAQFCVMNKLKTLLEKPQETFLALEVKKYLRELDYLETLRVFAWPIDNTAKKMEASSPEQTNRSSTPSSTVNPPITLSSSGEVNVSTDKALEKCMYNAYEGAALSLPQLRKSWVQACEHEAAGNIEQAAYEYKLLLNEHFKSLSIVNETKEDSISVGLVKFLTRKVYDCYLSLH
ncbi:unnamed protein product [Rotaria socialis]|uniref:Uncharacterized protein n=1 Tax=Rotaria socialis TaxID=392032 RepID=A0A817NED0_9BILA|nr:unnamed protein product [Rotaria socialis]CAF4422721.1 unnamed protein product [Rotaria socialis]